ncbi:ABC transporter permease [Blautia pseudococcoides]|nr:ABC transporter permease [Blautia pseudococcoides]
MGMRTAAKLARQYSRYYLRQTLSIFFSILLSMSLLGGISSLIYSGRSSSREKARETEGDWHYYVDADQELRDEIDRHPKEKGYELKRIGHMETKAVIGEPYVISLIYGDRNYMDIMGRTLEEGEYPGRQDEIALDTYTIRNLQVEKKLGTQVTLGEKTYTLCGIVKSRPANSGEEMMAFVSEDTPSEAEGTRLYLRFDEEKKVYKQLEALMDHFKIPSEKLKRNNGLTAYVEGTIPMAFAYIIKTGLSLPEGKFTYILSSILRDNPGTNGNVISVVLILFSLFIIYSIYRISLQKRISQYGVLNVLGIGGIRLFQMMFLELWGIFLIGYPAGSLLGNLAAKALYSRFSRVFTGEGTVPGSFMTDMDSLVKNFVALSVLLVLVSITLCRKLVKMNLMEILRKNPARKRSRKIYSLKTENMPEVLTEKFMLERKGVFVGILFSLSLGGIIFLGTSYMTANTKANNTLTMKADDGLGSDMLLYEESNDLSMVIPEDTADRLKKIRGITKVLPTSYLLGEIPVKRQDFKWLTYYPEIGVKYEPECAERINQRNMELYGGRAVEDANGDFRLKTNVYGYEPEMIRKLSDYLLEGTIDPEALEKENAVILQTIMDGQGNYDGLKIRPGDTITLKVPKDQEVPEEVYKFQSGEEWYREKEFKVAALVNRTMAKTDFYIGEGPDSPSLIFTNKQMKDNFGVRGYQIIGMDKASASRSYGVEKQVREAVSSVPRCVLKDYTADIARENTFLKQKMLFFYGVGVILLIISVLHIMNSISSMVLSRRHEFGILRAMGISDRGYMWMMLKEALRYGIYASLVMGAGYVLVRRFLLYLMQKVYLFVLPKEEVSVWLILGLTAVNVLLSMAAVAMPVRAVLKDSVVEEIRR